MTTTARKSAEPVEPEKPKARTLASSVHVDGQWYQAGDTVPADVAKQINNESAWAAE